MPKQNIDIRNVKIQQAVGGKIVATMPDDKLIIYDDYTAFVVSHFFDGKVSAMLQQGMCISLDTNITATQIEKK